MNPRGRFDAPRVLEVRRSAAAGGRRAQIESGGGLPRSETQSRPGHRLANLLSVWTACGFGAAFPRLLCVACCSLATFSLRAADAAATFDIANKLYEERRFAEAAAAYETILEGGQASPALYFNLGNAWFKSGKIGRALLAYRRAEKLTPRDPDVRANLQFARNQVQGPTLRPARWQRALGDLSLDEWSASIMAGLWLTFVLLSASQLRPGWKSALRTGTVAAGAATLLLLSGLFLARSNGGAANVAVVIAPEVTVRHGPLEQSNESFSARDGAELRVLDQKDDWLQVSDGSRREGWIRRGDVTLDLN